MLLDDEGLFEDDFAEEAGLDDELLGAGNDVFPTDDVLVPNRNLQSICARSMLVPANPETAVTVKTAAPSLAMRAIDRKEGSCMGGASEDSLLRRSRCGEADQISSKSRSFMNSMYVSVHTVCLKARMYPRK